MKLQQTTDYLLLINEEAEIKEGDYFFWYDSDGDDKYVWKCAGFTENTHYNVKYFNNEFGCDEGDWSKVYSSKIIAYRPLTKEAKELDLPELPPFEEDIEKLAIEYAEKQRYWSQGVSNAFIAGYKAAQQSKQFSLEDINFVVQHTLGQHITKGEVSIQLILDRLYTQQLPKEFIPEYIKIPMITPDMDATYLKALKTITNSEGKEELVGTYR